MRALVTGGNGFLGSHLVRHLLDADDHVAVLVRPSSDLRRIGDVLGNVAVITGDLSTVDEAADQIRTWLPDVVYHLAWSGIHGAGRNDAAAIRTNVCGALGLVETVARAGCRIWVGLGSQAEFGPTTGPLRDQSPTRPETSYGASKLAAGQLTAHLCRAQGIKHAWLRLLSAYGPMDEPGYVIPYIIGEFVAGRTPVLSAGSQIHDTLHAKDVASALRCAAVSPECAGFFVLSSGTAPTVRDIATTIRDLAAPGAGLVFGGLETPPYGLSGLPDGLTTTTGWTPSIGLEQGLRETVDWYGHSVAVHAS